ncbi:threonine dehydratase [Roseobacter litoralis]|uniref:Threo-3-hydroxyaspartate ammonia-lyase n=1 Tax=Roseobacter litoralis (strain ATCC 49566 / DSM 6996 / JCM 21268 / NBRC 15278 / OCh 149) TaxID=391595 RepID=F7ZKI3_ROSLO|nr:threonine dehydratase [Roseobacter litoralis]AEI95197.1 putative threo-3-hydroxyaspartate ammonia-lyase [Roseobacter litoralis Och 149]
MPLFNRTELEAAAGLVHHHMSPTPQYTWPLLNQEIGTEVWVKHENHTPTGAFKVRGGVTYIDHLKRSKPNIRGICTATRGNHGQSQARAATAAGLIAKIYVPEGNSSEKNAAMAAFGGEVIVYGPDFDVARMEAMRVAEDEGLAPVPPFHPELVRGVASYALEFFTAAPELDTVYVPIGCGSGICSVITVRDALGLKTKVVGVVSTEAQAAKLSFEVGRLIETNSANTFADGMAVRIPVQGAFDIYSKGAERIVAVSDAEVAEAIRAYYRCTHNVAEGAGAAPLAALMQEREAMRGKRVGVIHCGGNIDTEQFITVLKGGVPQV